MPDLWKALGDVYGDGQADGPPVRREPAASERAPEPTSRYSTTLPLDDDLAAALSAALVNAPTPGAEAPVAPVFQPPTPALPLVPPAPPVPDAAPAAVAPPFAPAPPVPSVPPLPSASVDLGTVLAPAAAQAPVAVAPPPPGEVQGRVSSWIAEIEDRNRRREEGPDLAAAVADGPVWARTDDDILPVARKRGRRR